MIFLRFVAGWPAGGGLFGAGRFDSGGEFDEEAGERPVDALVRMVMPELAAAVNAEDEKCEDFKKMTKVERDEAERDGRAPNFNLLNSGKALLCCVEMVGPFSICFSCAPSSLLPPIFAASVLIVLHPPTNYQPSVPPWMRPRMGIAQGQQRHVH